MLDDDARLELLRLIRGEFRSLSEHQQPLDPQVSQDSGLPNPTMQTTPLSTETTPIITSPNVSQPGTWLPPLEPQSGMCYFYTQLYMYL